jgi:hypothetical protein
MTDSGSTQGQKGARKRSEGGDVERPKKKGGGGKGVVVRNKEF